MPCTLAAPPPAPPRYFVKLNPDLLLEVGRAYLSHCGAEPEVLDPSSPDAIVLAKATRVLQTVATQAPGVLDGQLLLAQARRRRAPSSP